MGSLLTLPFAYLIQKVFNIEIKVNPFWYLISKFTQLFSKSNPINDLNLKKKRFDFFDPRKFNDLKKIGLFPNDQEFEFELPNQVRISF
jgi:hypothetical protein